MSKFEVIVFVVALVAGIPLMLRPIAARRFHARLLVMSKAFLKEARLRNQRYEQDTVDVSDLILWYAGAIPLIVAGAILPLPEDEKSKHEDLSMEVYLDSNAWALGYVASVHGLICVSLFLGRPWMPRYWGQAIFWAFALKIAREKNGTVKVLLNAPCAAERVNVLRDAKERAVATDSLAFC
jgi:hypothetical protein